MEKEKKFCISCGSLIEEGHNYCAECGNEVRSINVVIPKEKKINKQVTNKNNIPVIIVIIMILFVTLFFIFFFVIRYTFDNYSNISEGNKNVTITDTGIAEAVDKVYDTVVIVETYKSGKLYSTGTGFVYETSDDLGYILTNNHVIEDGDEIKVVFTSGDSVTSKVVGTDAYSDIAVLSVEKKYVTEVAIIGSSSDVRVGDTTFAVGAPLDSEIYSWTVTRGIISGKNRLVEVPISSSLNSSENYVMDVLQTDAAINSGNSGGPLCNSNGEVIGITNMKIASSSIEGMGFAIPIETAISYAKKFVNNEKIVRPYLGISMYDSGNRFSTVDGIYIASVAEDSPAQKAGLQKGDVITKIGNTDVTQSSYLKYELYKYEAGDNIKLTYVRDSKTYEITVTLGSSK